MFTERCNSRCRHCGVTDQMSRNLDMPVEDAIRYVDEIAALAAEENDTFSIFFSGGEVFLRYDDVLAVTRHAKSRGATPITCVSNGYWGKDPAQARRWATDLKEAGMRTVCISMDDFHQEYVPLESEVNALRACSEAGMALAIKSAVTRRTRRLPDVLRDVADLLADNPVLVHEMSCSPEGRAATTVSQDDLLLRDGVLSEPCPGMGVLTFLPDGTAFPCCGVGWTSELVVGNARQEPVLSLVHRMRERDLFAVLKYKGPGFFVPYFDEIGQPLPSQGYVNACHLCMAVLDHPALAQVLPSALTDWRIQEMKTRMGPLWALGETDCAALRIPATAGQGTSLSILESTPIGG